MRRRNVVLLQCVLFSCIGSANAITIETVPIGDVGNPAAPGLGIGYGGVNYGYNIGKFEVTVGQYTEFLNAVAGTDTYSLYNSAMSIDLNIAGISRSGSSGSYTYSVIGSVNHPVTYVSWGDAARFTNWLHNGQPTGAQSNATTEDGAYFLNGAISNATLGAVVRKVNAKWFIPTENEWYKAAYYQPAAAGGDSDNYWQYPMKTNSDPYSDQPSGTTPDNTRVGNFKQNDGLANDYDGGYAVTNSTAYDSTQNYLTDVGAYNLSPSFYGTYDQGGNVREWNETIVNSASPGVRGGDWGDTVYSLRTSYRGVDAPAIERPVLGFRVAAAAPVPEPTSLVLFSIAAVMLGGSRLRKWRD